MGRGFGSLTLRFGREQLILAALVVIYVLSGALGLSLAYDHTAATMVWPPAGLALGALLVLGYRAWPAILISDAVVYAVRWGRTPRGAVAEGLRELRSVDAPIAGIALTMIDEARADCATC